MHILSVNLEKILNSRIVRGLFRYYSTNGSRCLEDLFGGNRVRSPLSFLGRAPMTLALKAAMKRLGFTERMQELFFSFPWNRHTLLNVMRTIGKNGLARPFRFDAPLVVVWNFTNVCNLRCRYCYQSAGAPLADELTYERKIDLVDQMVDAHVAFLAFSGGEPILGDRFWDVCKHASRSLHITIATNGIAMADRAVVDRLVDHGVKNAFVSLDGATAESHDFIRGSGSFAKTIEGIGNLVAHPHIQVGINTVVTRRNLREVPAILELACRLGVNSFSHYNFIPTGRGRDDFENDLLPEERERLLNLLYDWFEKSGETKLGIISTAPNYARIIHERSRGRRSGLFHYTTDTIAAISGIVEYAGGCGAGRVYAALQPNGVMTPCVFMPGVPIGDTRKERFADIWRNSEICAKMVDRDRFTHGCAEYRYICGGCRARAHAYGNLFGDDPGCLEYRRRTASHAAPGVEPGNGGAHRPGEPAWAAAGGAASPASEANRDAVLV
jgi:MoaA/NifB/PqqE/SkfB family radical SAM enzyme